ncbi:MAG: hypothetical protein Q4B30_04170 [Coriobacteriaceae bacterium]|nr:hypothetical protein [Coriobacteriaceae bacterium]
MNPAAVVIIVLFFVYFIGREVTRRRIDTHLQALYIAGRYDDCIAYLDRKLSRILMSTYRQYYLRFTVYEAAGDSFSAGRMLDHLLDMHASKSKRLDLVLRAFNFYVGQGSKKQAKEMLEEVSSTAPALQAADAKLTYDIVFEHDTSHLHEMERLVKKADDPAQRAKLLFLMSKQYKTMNRRDRERACLDEIEKMENSSN